jgi:hypothetical protein
MKKLFSMLLMPVIIGLLSSGSFAQLTGREIMQKISDQGDIKTEFGKSKMTLINNKGKTREREVIRYQRSYDGENGIDSKALIFFEYPADIRGTGLLLWNYQAADKDDDRWLYLPALKKIRRIAGESKNEYFMGTDFTYDDMGDRNVDEDTHTLLGQEIIDGIECYKVESVPVGENDQYAKKITWVIPDKWVFLKVEFYEKNGDLQKVLTASDIREVDGIWTPYALFMDNVSKTHQTKIEILEVQYNGEMKDQIFTQNTLQRGRVQ